MKFNWNRNFRKFRRQLAIIFALIIIAVPFQNCGNNFSAISEPTSTSSSQLPANQIANEEPPPVGLTQDQINSQKCAANFNAPSFTIDTTTLSINSGLATDSGDTGPASLPKVTPKATLAILNPQVQGSANCATYTLITNKCSIVENDNTRPILLSNGVDLTGTQVIPANFASLDAASKKSLLDRAITLTNCNNQRLNVDPNNSIVYSKALRVDLNRSNANNNSFLRCVEGSFYIKMYVEHSVDGGANNDVVKPMAAQASYQYVKINLQNSCWKESRLKANADFSRLALAGTDVYTDGIWSLVVAPDESMGPITNAGAVYVFKIENGSWNFHSKIQVPQIQSGESLTKAVVNGSNLVVSSAGRSGNQGAIFIYKLSGNTWIYQQEVTAPSPQAGQLFGYSLALDANFLVVGAPLYSSKNEVSNRAGRIYIFNTANFSAPQQTFENPDLISYANKGFGMSVAISGGTFAVGAPQAPGKESLGQGMVHLYSLNNGIWSFASNKASPIPQNGLSFGSAISLFAGKLLVGAPGYIADSATNTPKANAGMAFYYDTLDSQAPTQLTGGDTYKAASVKFGNSVGMSAKGIFISAPFLAVGTNGNRNGAVCFMTFAAAPTNKCDFKIFSTNSVADDAFGSALSVSGNFVLIGAKIKDDPNTDSGAAYVIEAK